MKRYRVILTAEFELLAPDAMTIVNDASTMVQDMGPEPTMIDIHVKEIEEDKIVNLTPKDSEI